MRIHGIELSAFWILRLTATPNWPSFTADTANFFSFLAALIVEQPARNPYWLALKARFPRKCSLSRSAMTCSKIFPTVSSMQSDRNEAGSPTGLPGFCNSTSRATFHQVGNIPLFNARLNTASSIPDWPDVRWSTHCLLSCLDQVPSWLWHALGPPPRRCSRV